MLPAFATNKSLVIQFSQNNDRLHISMSLFIKDAQL